MRTSIELDFLKRPAILITLLGVLLIGLIWWFGWMQPQGNKLTNINAEQTSSQDQISSLQSQIIQLEAEAAQVQKELPYKYFFEGQIPPIPEQGDLTKQLYELSLKTKTFISSLDDSTIAPPATSTTPATGSTGTSAPTTGYSTMPITIDLTGNRNSVLAFLQGIYKLPRLVTIQGVTLTPPATASNLDKPNTVTGFTASITATAYTTYLPPAATST